MYEIAKRIFVNHRGTILSKEEINLASDEYQIMDGSIDVEYLGESKSLIQYTRQKSKNNLMR